MDSQSFLSLWDAWQAQLFVNDVESLHEEGSKLVSECVSCCVFTVPPQTIVVQQANIRVHSNLLEVTEHSLWMVKGHRFHRPTQSLSLCVCLRHYLITFNPNLLRRVNYLWE